MKKSKCLEIDDLITAWVWGDELGPRERKKLGRHLLRCPRCRKSVIVTRQIYKRVQEAEPEDVEVPDWVLEENLQSSEETLQLAVNQWHEEKARRRNRLMWVPVAGMIAFIAVSLWSGLRDRGASEGRGAYREEKAGERPASPEQIAAWETFAADRLRWRSNFAETEDAAEALKLLQDFYELSRKKSQLPNSDLTGFDTVIILCRKLIERWPDSREAALARRLIYRSYAARGETEKARTWFLAYAEAVGRWTERKALERGASQDVAGTKGRERTGRILYGKGVEFFFDKSYLEAAFYFDAVREHCEELEVAARAMYMKGRVFTALEEPRDAVLAYQKVIEESREGPLRRKAYEDLSTEAFNMGLKAKAVQVMEQMAERSLSYDHKAYALYRAAFLQQARGQKYYPDAIEKLQKVIKKYPDTKHATAARRLVARLEREVLDEIKIQ